MPNPKTNPAEYFESLRKSKEALADFRNETPKNLAQLKELIKHGEYESGFAMLDLLQQLVNTLVTATLDCLKQNNQLKLVMAITNREEAEAYYRAAVGIGEQGLADQVVAIIEANQQWMALSIDDLEV